MRLYGFLSGHSAIVFSLGTDSQTNALEYSFTVDGIPRIEPPPLGANPALLDHSKHVLFDVGPNSIPHVEEKLVANGLRSSRPILGNWTTLTTSYVGWSCVI